MQNSLYRIAVAALIPLVLLACSIVPPIHGASSVFIPASNRVDMVYDGPRDVLYITCSNSILRYRLSDGGFLPSIPLGGSLMGIDLSPDGNRLIVADSTANPSNVWVHSINLNTEEATKALFRRANGEAGTFAVAFGGDGAVLITSTYSGSGDVPLRRYDPVTLQTTTIASVRHDSMVSSSADGTTIILAQSHTSAGPFNRYDVALRSVIRGAGNGWFNYECAANRDASVFAIPTAGGTYIYDDYFTQITSIGVYFGQQPIGAAFHPSANAVFFPFAQTSVVRAYDTTTWEMLAQFECHYTFGNTGENAFKNGRIRISPDGEILFVTVGGGVRYFRHDLNLVKSHKLVVGGNPGPIGVLSPIPYGTIWLARGTNLTLQAPAITEANGIRFHTTGWTGTGSVPSDGTNTAVNFLLLTNSTINWHWNTNEYQLSVSISGSGTVNITNGWYLPGAMESITAKPASNFLFLRWLGTVEPCAATNSTLTVMMDRPRSLIALFSPMNGTASLLPGDWKTFGNGPEHTGYFPGGLGNGTFSLSWVTNVNGSLFPLKQAAIAEGIIFLTANDFTHKGYVAALRESDGSLAWRYDFGDSYTVNPPTYDQGYLFVQRNGLNGTTALWNFNAMTGTTNWVAPHGAQVEHYLAPTVADGKVWISGGNYGGLYGFIETNGMQLFYQGLQQVGGWSPTYYGGKLYTWVGGNFRAHDPLTGVVLWSTNLTWSWWGATPMDRTVAVSDGFAYFNGLFAMFGIDLSSARVTWQETNRFSGTPAVAKGIVYSISDSNVLAFSKTGEYLGSYTADMELTSQPILTDDLLIVSSSSQTYVFDLCTHNLHQTLPVGGNLTLANGVLYVAGADGNLYAYSSTPPLRITLSFVNQGSGNLFVLRWPSMEGKKYDVMFTADLSSPFSVIVSNLTATPPYNTYQPTLLPYTRGYYRVEAK
jgi:hypothetical protein